jgi:AraC family transcriptional regulator, regulatory protein of adaptative response / methylated-DNA-[protein]-cysteine methyltransferase
MDEVAMPIRTESLAAKWIETPLGRMIAVAGEREIVYLEFAEECDSERPIARVRSTIDFTRARPVLEVLAREMDEYFAGRLTEFSVSAAPQGSDFERLAWDYLRTIPFGQTRSYGQQARAIAGPDAARAVGRANGANPIAILIPCHRVIGADGSLTGYGGGMHRKRWLLEHERRYCRAEEGMLPFRR